MCVCMRVWRNTVFFHFPRDRVSGIFITYLCMYAWENIIALKIRFRLSFHMVNRLQIIVTRTLIVSVQICQHVWYLHRMCNLLPRFPILFFINFRTLDLPFHFWKIFYRNDIHIYIYTLKWPAKHRKLLISFSNACIGINR